jgi:RNA polymerase sigma factor (sigma-70 family)
MKLITSFRNITEQERPAFERTLHELAARHLEQRLESFPADLPQLHARLERSRHGPHYYVKLRLAVPGASLVAAEDSADAAAALRKAFAELERELDRHAAHLRHEEEWHRKEKRELLRRFKQALADEPAARREAFGDRVRPLLPPLRRFIAREMGYLRARGDLAPGWPTVQDLLDETLARAWETRAEGAASDDPRHWLYGIVGKVLAAEVAQRRREEGRFVSIESRPPELLPDETMDERDEGIYEFLQPDELLRFEDVTPDPAAGENPEDTVNREEMRRLLHEVLAQLPTQWRRAVWLVQAEGMKREDVARQLNVSEEDVKRWIEQADAFLRARLQEAGLTPAGDGKPPEYAVPLPATETPELRTAFDEVLSAKPPAADES